MEIMQLEYYSITDIERWQSPKNISFEHEYLKTFKITNKHTKDKPEKFVI